MPLLKKHMGVEIHVDEGGKFSCNMNGKKHESGTLRNLELLIEKAMVTPEQGVEGVIYSLDQRYSAPSAAVPSMRVTPILGIEKSRSKCNKPYKFKVKGQWGETTVDVLYKPDEGIAKEFEAIKKRVEEFNRRVAELYEPLGADIKALAVKIEATRMRPEDFAK